MSDIYNLKLDMESGDHYESIGVLIRLISENFINFEKIFEKKFWILACSTTIVVVAVKLKLQNEKFKKKKFQNFFLFVIKISLATN